MGLFKLFKSKGNQVKEQEPTLVWNRLTTTAQLDAIIEESKTIPVVIFKHSTRCGISRMVLRNFEGTYNIQEKEMKLYFLDLLAYREVSNEVGYKFQVLHQSPQLIVIKNGLTVAHASHHGIRAEELVNFV